MSALSFSILFSAPAGAQESGPKITVVGPEEFDVELTDHPTEFNDTARLEALLVNNTSSDAMNPTFTIWLDQQDSECSNQLSSIAPEGGAPTHIAPNQAIPVRLILDIPRACSGESGTLLMETAGFEPTQLRFMVTRDPELSLFWIPIIVALIVFTVFLGLMLIIVNRKSKGLCHPIGAGSAWSFKDSWLTNISTLGAIVTTVLAASGLLGELLPGVPTDRYLGVGLLFGGAILTAPLLYSMSSKWHYAESEAGKGDWKLQSTGRAWGVVVAAAVTLSAVTGQLATLFLIDMQSEAPSAARYVVAGCIAAGFVIAAAYTTVFALGATKLQGADKVDIVSSEKVSGTA